MPDRSESVLGLGPAGRWGGRVAEGVYVCTGRFAFARFFGRDWTRTWVSPGHVFFPW